MTEKELFISWLNDAYSTELAMMPVLENHAKDASDFPQIRDRQMQHLEETRRQAERLETMIERLGGKVSTVKSITGKTLGLGKSVSTGIFSDEMIKNFLADYAAEHLEIASYKSLIAAAKHIGEEHCVPVLEQILAEEVAMASWLKEHIPMATVESLRVTTNDIDRKRSKKSSRTKSRAAGLFKPTGLVTLLGVGAVAAGAAMILRAPQNKNEDNASNRSLDNGDSHGESFVSNSVAVDGSFADETNDFEQTDIVIAETLIVTDEPEIIRMRDSEREGF